MPVRDDYVRDEIMQVGGRQLRVAIRPGTGTGPPLLLCNGIGMRLEALQPFVDALDPAIEVIRFDAPGKWGYQRSGEAQVRTDGRVLEPHRYRGPKRQPAVEPRLPAQPLARARSASQAGQQARPELSSPARNAPVPEAVVAGSGHSQRLTPVRIPQGAGSPLPRLRVLAWRCAWL